jgi:hypothetical protein
MTPQPSALAALQRYDIDGKGVRYLSVNGYYFVADDVLAAWPTQAQGAVAWQQRRNFHTHGYGDWENISKNAYDDGVTHPNINWQYRKLSTHPSPSTAALREAYERAIEECPNAVLNLGDAKGWIRERTRTLLEGDN